MMLIDISNIGILNIHGVHCCIIDRTTKPFKDLILYHKVSGKNTYYEKKQRKIKKNAQNSSYSKNGKQNTKNIMKIIKKGFEEKQKAWECRSLL